MKGIYFLLLKLKEPMEKRIGALGKIKFEAGNYIYVGSAQKNLEARVARHFSSEKRKHWHIDYFLESADIEEVLAFEMDREMECYSARILGEEFDNIKNFGCSDCDCTSHLFFTRNNLKEIIEKITTKIGEEETRSIDLDLQ